MSPVDITDGAALYTEEFKKFNTYLMDADRKSASEMILKMVDEGAEIIDIYKHIFKRSQYEIGRLWETNRISVAQEHFCTAATQMIISQLYPHVFSSEKNGKKVIAACIGGELHEIGIRMIADIFELNGWDSYFIGANTPGESILETIRRTEADLLAISASMTFNVLAVRDLISYIRSEVKCEELKIIVGGRPFNVSPGLWKMVGADCWAPDSEEALSEAEKITGEHCEG